jgi:hypothetical protein
MSDTMGDSLIKLSIRRESHFYYFDLTESDFSYFGYNRHSYVFYPIYDAFAHELSLGQQIERNS